ncbi:MAG TPA: sigma-70 family RNA polymerase sigma factor [Gemmataceae bacterium]|nr:sigma-70 family RNA polymerase sigma factor [Gemmataceae bacterium]
MKTPDAASPRSRRHYVVAMLLGTALSALGTASASQAAAVGDVSVQAVNNVSRYCTACWRNARLPMDYWSDCTQDVFSRLLERIPTQRWDQLLAAEGEERQEFLRAIDAVKKRTQRGLKRSLNLNSVVADSRDGQERSLADEREAVHRAASELLSDRQQRILQMSFEGWSVQDIAAELQLPAERVSDEKYKAIRKLREHLCHSGNDLES